MNSVTGVWKGCDHLISLFLLCVYSSIFSKQQYEIICSMINEMHLFNLFPNNCSLRRRASYLTDARMTAAMQDASKP